MVAYLLGAEQAAALSLTNLAKEHECCSSFQESCYKTQTKQICLRQGTLYRASFLLLFACGAGGMLIPMRQFEPQT
ncbi:hypothetical protein IQ06DRAFT_112164 [Phaeosphaeriaceae sp. SRC1lsM3a]|nr:hypothetical protein IQ06DRAFT_112164 [Stagonospora sp. SRC1lsM3a]